MRSIVEHILMETMYNLPMSGCKKVRIVKADDAVAVEKDGRLDEKRFCKKSEKELLEEAKENKEKKAS